MIDSRLEILILDMLRKKEIREQLDHELRGLRANERVFCLDKNLFLVYTGTNSSDLQPFIRVGSGEKIHRNSAAWIGHVILSEQDPVNLGREIEWIEHAIEKGFASIKYVGSKKRLDQIYNITGMPQLEDKGRNVPIQILPYGKINGEKDKIQVYAIQERENFSIQINNRRVFDYNDRVKNKSWSVETEYKLFAEALQKMPRTKASDPQDISFVWVKGRKFDKLLPTLYWNCLGKGFIFEPSSGFHQDLFECHIDPTNVVGYSASDGLTSGLNNGLLYAHQEHQEICVNIADENQFVGLKKIYNSANLRQMTAGVALPFAKSMFLSKSRRGNYSALSWRFSAQSDYFVNVLFPSMRKSAKKQIENIRAPYDVEIQKIDTHDDFKLSTANLQLQYPGAIDQETFELKKIRGKNFPLIPNTEYIFHQAENLNDIMDVALRCFRDTEYLSSLTKIYQFHQVAELKSETDYLRQSLEELLYIHRSIENSQTTEFVNLASFVQVLKYTVTFGNYTKEQMSRYNKLEKTISLTKYRNSDLLGLQSKEVTIQILSFGNREKKSILFIDNLQKDKLPWHLPREILTSRQQEKQYGKKLILWQKIIGRKKEYEEYLPILQVLEKMVNQQQFFKEQWIAFRKLVERLGTSVVGESIFGERPYLKQSKKSWSDLVSNGFNLGSLKDVLIDLKEKIMNPKGLIIFALLALSSFLLVIMVSRYSPSTPEFIGLVDVGNFQENENIPGAEEIEITDAEIFEYANILATQNNFQSLEASIDNNENAKRNPNLIFPSDLLRLPDQRLTRVKSGSYIWEIARNQYQQDFARLLLLEKEISENGSKKDIEKYIAWVKRLAVTKKMKEVLLRLQPTIESL